jgi:hypothetical protein
MMAQDNSAQEVGGAIAFVQTSNLATVDDSIFINNTAYAGGAIVCTEGVAFNNCEFRYGAPLLHLTHTVLLILTYACATHEETTLFLDGVAVCICLAKPMLPLSTVPLSIVPAVVSVVALLYHRMSLAGRCAMCCSAMCIGLTIDGDSQCIPRRFINCTIKYSNSVSFGGSISLVDRARTKFINWYIVQPAAIQRLIDALLTSMRLLILCSTAPLPTAKVSTMEELCISPIRLHRHSNP